MSTETATLTDSTVWFDKRKGGFINSYEFMEGLKVKQRLYRLALNLIPNAIEEGEIALDIGSGLSTIEPYITKKGYRYLATDFSPAMLKRAQELHTGVDIVQSDLLAGLPLAAGSAQLITGINVLYNFSEEALQQIVVPELARVLRPGGRLVIANPMPAANNKLIVLEEFLLRIRNGENPFKLAKQMKEHTEFRAAQEKLAADALKLPPKVWVEMLEAHGFGNAQMDNRAYAWQASIISMQKQ